jgi:hypothetical protein
VNVKSNGPTPAAPQDVVTRRRRGAPPGNRNALKSGRHTNKLRAMRKQVAACKRTMKALIEAGKTQLRASRSFQHSAAQNAQLRISPDCR